MNENSDKRLEFDECLSQKEIKDKLFLKYHAGNWIMTLRKIATFTITMHIPY